MGSNNLVRSTGFTADAARQEAAISGSRYYPLISFEKSFVASNAPTQTFMMKLDQGWFTQNDFLLNNLNNPSVQHDFKTVFTLQTPIFDPSIAPAKEMASKEAEKQGIGYDATKEDMAFQVFGLFLEVRKSMAQVCAVELAIGDARENMRLATVSA